MKIFIKNIQEIKKIRFSNRLAVEVLEMIEEYIQPGITTEELNSICHNYIINKQNAIPASLGYLGFPKSICTSVNNVVCHGIPNKHEILKSGDIINIDIAIVKDGYYGDTSKMFFVGKIKKIAKKLCDITKNSLYSAIKIIKPGIRLYNIGLIIQKYVESYNFSVVKQYCGHGIGKYFHEQPQILHYHTNDQGITLIPGMIFTIEPMINIGNASIFCMSDGWTVKTQDNSLSAQYEHTILVTKKGCEILTLQNGEFLNI